MAISPEESIATAPLPNSYWVIPGRLLAGEYPGGRTDIDTDTRIERLLQAGIDAFLDLTKPAELPPYHTRLPFSVEYDRKPIRDHGVPDHPAQMTEIVELLLDALARGRKVYVHCRAGIGRTGMAMACLLIERGLTSHAALDELNRLWQQSARSSLWPTVPETTEQAEFVRFWDRERPQIPPPARAELDDEARSDVVSPRLPPPPPVREVLTTAMPARAPQRSLQQRFVGAMLGLAIGDALSAGTQGKSAGELVAINGPVGGGPDNLPAGAWSDDTAMSLCLAESLLEKPGFDGRDQMARYRRWQAQGYLSATGVAAGLTSNVAQALSAAQWRRQVFAGPHDPSKLDPDALTRTAPAVLYFFYDRAEAIRQSAEAARACSQVPVILAANRAVALMLHAALSGASRTEVFAPDTALLALPNGADAKRLAAILSADSTRIKPQDLQPQGNALDLLEAALWCLGNQEQLRSALLAAANLGGRSDIVTALVGLIGGAYYGADALPRDWLERMAQRDLVVGFAERLHAAALAGAPV
jgi:ADP-ribosyl-[dinitrogen reductase] hydrolase